MKRALAALLVSFAAQAQEPAAQQRALLDLYVNEVKGETVLVYLPDDGDAAVPVAELTKAGLRGFGGRREMHDGVEYVFARSLAPQVAYRLDLERLEVHLTAQTSLLPTMKLDLRPDGRPPDMVFRTDTSGFLNYAVTGTSGAGFGGAAELGATYKTNLLYTGLSMAPGGNVVRGLSNVVMDDVPSLRRTTLGDGFFAGGALGGAALIGGIVIAKEFSLDPYYVRTPMPRMRGAVLTPSTLDVYVNGQLVRSTPVAPGAFEVNNIPVNSGAGSYSYVVRDAFGRTQEFAAPYYASASLLARGVSEYSYALGFRRQGFGITSFNYGPPAFSATHRLGLTDTVAAGYRFEAAAQRTGPGTWNGLASGGLSMVTALPLGELAGELAASADGARGGGAAFLGYQVVSPRVSAGVAARALSAWYAKLGLPAVQDRARLGVHGFVGAQLHGPFSGSVDYDLQSQRDAGLTSRVGLRLDGRLGKKTMLSMSLARVREAGAAPGYEGEVMLLYAFGDRTMGTAGAAQGGAGTSGSMTLQRSIPLGEGLGYQLQSAVDGSGRGSGSGFIQGNLPHNVVSATYNRADVSDSASATIAGSLVTVGGGVFASRPVQQGYALVQVPGVEGVRGYLNNQEIGRTDSRGDLLVPDLQPYYANRLRIAPEDVPLEYVVGKPAEAVATSYRGGALVQFEARKIQAVSGTVTVRDEVPLYGELTVSAGAFAQSSPIGSRGEFFLEKMQPGRYHAAIEFARGTCSFELDVPAAAAATVDLGALRCTALQPAATASQ